MPFGFRFPRKRNRTPSRARPPLFRPRLELLERRDLLATITVTNPGDSGTNTLRAAILQANGDNGDLIRFNISGGGVQTISLQSALPQITAPMTIDGYSQLGANGPRSRRCETTPRNWRSVRHSRSCGGVKMTGWGCGSRWPALPWCFVPVG